MHCDEVRRVLPLSSGTPDEQERIHDHVNHCAECEQLATAYEADARALTVYRSQREEAPAAMAGFADALMARIAEEPAPMAEAPILKPEFGQRSSYSTLLAIAAAVLVAVALGLVLGSSTPETQPVVADNDTQVVVPSVDIDEPDVDGMPLVDAADDSPPLAAPRRARDRAPMPRLRSRRRGGIVPVDDTQRPTLSNLLRDLQRVFPNWSPNGLDRRVPPLRKNEREVRF